MAREPGAARGSAGSSAPCSLAASNPDFPEADKEEFRGCFATTQSEGDADSRPRKRPPPLSEPPWRGSAGPPSEPQSRGHAMPPRKKPRTRSSPGIPYAGERAQWNQGFLRTADGEKVPSTISLPMNVIVVTKAATKQDVFNCILSQTAGVVIVVWDPELVRTSLVCDPQPLRDLKHAVRDACDLKNNSEEPYWTTVDLVSDTGVVLSRPHLIASTVVAEQVVGATHAVTILLFRLKVSKTNPDAVLPFAVVSRHAATEPLQPKITRTEQTAWEESFIEDCLVAIHAWDVRFLCGLFDIPPEQFQAFCRSCGASYKSPLAVLFRAGPALFGGIKEGTRVVHPNYIVPIGPCDVRIADYNTDFAGRPTTIEPQWLPDWMVRPCDSLIARRWVPTQWMPKWDDDPDRSSGLRRDLDLEALPPIGKVIQKTLNDKTFLAHWRAGLHQNFVFVGHGRQGQHKKSKQDQARSAAVADERRRP